MNIKEFVETFIHSDFAVRNIRSHLQAGFPVPVVRKDGLGIELYYHKLTCADDRLTLSAPVLKVGLVYPSGRIYLFTELGDTAYETGEIVITANRLYSFRSAFESAYAACGDVTGFYDSHAAVTPIMMKKCYQALNRASDDIGAGEWYGGAYDQDRGI